MSASNIDARLVRLLEALACDDRQFAIGLVEDLLAEVEGDGGCDYCKGALSVAERNDARAARRSGYAGLCSTCLHRLSTRAA